MKYFEFFDSNTILAFFCVRAINFHIISHHKTSIHS